MSKSNQRLLTIVLVAAIILAPLAVIAFYVFDDDERTIQGAFLVSHPDNYVRLGDYCAGEGLFEILDRGTVVRVWDAFGNVLATSSTFTGDQLESTCSFRFTLENVASVDEYHFQFGDQPVYVIDRETLEQSDWSPIIQADQVN